MQGHRQEARDRRLVRAQVPAQGAAGAVHGPAPEHRARAPHLRDAVRRPHIHGLLRGRRPAQLHGHQEDAVLADAHVFRVSAAAASPFPAHPTRPRIEAAADAFGGQGVPNSPEILETNNHFTTTIKYYQVRIIVLP